MAASADKFKSWNPQRTRILNADCKSWRLSGQRVGLATPGAVCRFKVNLKLGKWRLDLKLIQPPDPEEGLWECHTWKNEVAGR